MLGAFTSRPGDLPWPIDIEVGSYVGVEAPRAPFEEGDLAAPDLPQEHREDGLCDLDADPPSTEISAPSLSLHPVAVPARPRPGPRVLTTALTVSTAALCAAIGYAAVSHWGTPESRDVAHALYESAVARVLNWRSAGPASGVAKPAVAGTARTPDVSVSGVSSARRIQKPEVLPIAASAETPAGNVDAPAGNVDAPSGAARADKVVEPVATDAVPIDPLAALEPVHALFDSGDPVAAMQALKALPPRMRNGPEGRTVRARLLVATGRFRAALRAIAPVRAEAARTPDQLLAIGDVLHSVGRVNTAAGAYELALAVMPDHLEALVGRAEVHLRAERPTDAIELLTRVRTQLGSQPPRIRARLFAALGHAYLQRGKRGDRASAEAVLRRALGLPNPPAAAHFWLGESVAGRNTPAASEAYSAYLSRAPKGRYAARARRAMGPLL